MITDQNGCSQTEVAIVGGATMVEVNAQTTNASCSDSADGIIALSVSQGTAPFSYTWSDNVSVGPTAQNLAPGSYSVTILDATGCSAIINRTNFSSLSITSNYRFR